MNDTFDPFGPPEICPVSCRAVSPVDTIERDDHHTDLEQIIAEPELSLGYRLRLGLLSVDVLAVLILVRSDVEESPGVLHREYLASLSQDVKTIA